MTSTEIKDEYEQKYGKKIRDYLVNMSLQRVLLGNKDYLGENPTYLVNLLLQADMYLWDKLEEIEGGE